MCQRVIELDPEAAEMERKERRKKPCDESILKMLDEAHEEWEAQQAE
jgi:hypothetical protein